MKDKLKVNSFLIESESEQGIFLFIPFTPGHHFVFKVVRILCMGCSCVHVLLLSA